jgi:fructokinase
MQPGNEPMVGLGEILWDLLPEGRQLGGAPFNFAFHCHQLGYPALMVSRVGNDELGADIRAAVRRAGLADDYLQEDDTHPTGTVAVSLDSRGQPTFVITPEVAYDYLAWDERLVKLLEGAQALCFGTLMQRHPVARATVQRMLKSAGHALVVYDVNLRQDYYTRAIIEASLTASNWVKLNDDELGVLKDLLHLAGADGGALLEDLRQRYHLQLAALTRGEHGCLVQTAQEEVDLPGVPIRVVDTIGAGDAFTAGLVVGMLEGQSLRHAAALANNLAARVAASAGGTPRIDRSDVV